MKCQHIYNQQKQNIQAAELFQFCLHIDREMGKTCLQRKTEGEEREGVKKTGKEKTIWQEWMTPDLVRACDV